MDRGAMGRAAVRDGTLPTRYVRWVIVAGTVAGAFALVTGPAASADTCPVFPLVACPSPADPPVSSTTTSQAPVTTTTVAQPTPAWARERLLALVNADRSTSGLPSLTARDDVIAIASHWSDEMASSGMLSHDDDYFSNATRSKLAAALLGENVARAGDVDSAHRALMASEHHRANILDARFTTIGIGATERDGTWWITEDFLQARTHARRAIPNDARRRSGERARAAASVVGIPAPASATPVSAVAAAPPHAVEVLPRVESGPAVSLLAGEGLVDPRLRLAVVAVAFVLTASVLVLRRASKRALVMVRPIAELGPAPVDLVEHGCIGDKVLEGGDAHGVQHRLAVIDAWVRTLDDRWQALSESDKRIALQIIRRNTRAALDELPDVVTATA